jgi:hypothetical protein
MIEMPKRNAIELLYFDAYIGAWDWKKRIRLPSLYPTKWFTVKVKASAYEGGYTTMQSNDLRRAIRRYGRTISYQDYKKLFARFGKK